MSLLTVGHCLTRSIYIKYVQVFSHYAEEWTPCLIFVYLDHIVQRPTTNNQLGFYCWFAFTRGSRQTLRAPRATSSSSEKLTKWPGTMPTSPITTRISPFEHDTIR